MTRADHAASALTKATKITCEVDKSLAADAQAVFAGLGADRLLVHPRRAVALRERASLGFLPATTRLQEDPLEVVELYVAPERARAALLACARELHLFAPGRGAVYAEAVELAEPPGLAFTSARIAPPHAREHTGERLAALSLVNCVVQRGQGNAIARSAIETGSNVPSVNFGIGTGVRDRLGLLRIAIPAEKEIVSLLVAPNEQAAALDAMIAAGRLDRPGRGFVAAYPVAFGVANPKSFRGQQRHSATMDQIISAIDELKSDTQWRERSGTARVRTRAARGWLADLVNVTLNCSEGHASRLATAAMAAGAGGATITRCRLIAADGAPFSASPARETIDFGLAPAKVDGLFAALQAAGAFEAETACLVETKPLPVAFTYLGS